jgi:hypothetical protein
VHWQPGELSEAASLPRGTVPGCAAATGTAAGSQVARLQASARAWWPSRWLTARLRVLSNGLRGSASPCGRLMRFNFATFFFLFN